MSDIKLRGIKMVAPVWDGSGYGEGSRFFVQSLLTNSQLPMFIHPVSFEQDRPDFTQTIFNKNIPEMGSMHDMLDALCRSPVPYDVNLVRLSPEVAVNFLDTAAGVNIISPAWETDSLDPYWVQCCNRFDAVFVESQFSVDVFKQSGVTAPVYLVPNGIDTTNYTPKLSVTQDTYKFYSIQQWTERKNGIGLLKAYFNAFIPEDDVILILKTYITRVEQAENQRELIKQRIEQLKKSLNMVTPLPPVYLITDKLTTAEITKMHEECDCYILLDRGEGFGLPYMEAAAAANPIIATDWGGSRQFLNKNNSYPVDYQLTYVDNMAPLGFPFYHGEQKWADPRLPHAAGIMRYVFEHREEAFKLGARAREDVRRLFNHEQVAKALLDAILDVVIKKRKL